MASSPHFCMMLPKGTSRDNKHFIIPMEFCMKYGKDLSNPVFFNLPTGSKWEIELRKWKGEVWFGKGWPEFYKSYSLDRCHSLIFRYEGNSKFRVCILDTSLTEIEYPLTMPETKETNCEDGSNDDSREKREQSPLQSPRPHKKSRRNKSGKVDFVAKGNGEGTSRSRRRTNKSGKVDFVAKGNGEGTSRSRRRTNKSGKVDFVAKGNGEGTSRSRRRTNKSGKVDFVAKGNGEGTSRSQRRTKSVIGRRRSLTSSGKDTALEKAIAHKSDEPFFIAPMNRSYIDGGSLWLMVGFAKKLPTLRENSANVTLQVLGGRSWSLELVTRPRPKFHSGWQSFVRDNKLQANDVCKFLLLDNIRLVFQVFIFRATEDEDCSLSPDVEGELKLPKMEETDEDVVCLGVSDEFPPHRKLSKRCRIEPQPREKNRSKQRIMNRGKVRRMDRGGTDRAFWEVEAFKSKYPSCKVTIRRSYIGGHYLPLPVEFGKKLNHAHDNVILGVWDGRSWPVKLTRYDGERIRLLSGWIAFVRDNRLEIGDFCLFELMDDIKPMIQVTIFRAAEAGSCSKSQAGEGSHRRPRR